MTTFDEALALLLDGVSPLPPERVPLGDLDGRVLAKDVVATHDQPTEPRSIMDGVGLARANGEDRYGLVGESSAGSPFTGELRSGQAVAISTGAVVPAGADRVVPKECLEFADEVVRVIEWPKSRFVRSPASDFRAGDRLLRAGTRLGPASLALVAAANFDFASVIRRPRVAVMTAGDELVEAGDPLGPGAAIDSASHSLAALVFRWGGTANRLHVGDDSAAIERAMGAAFVDHDLLVTVGGASVGDHDHMRPAARSLGAEMRFERIALKPGKPSWYARLPDGRIILGIPGNPASAFVCAHLLLQPLLMAMTGRPAGLDLRPMPLASPLAANGNREQFVRAVLTEDGLAPLSDQDSGLQAALARATHLVRQPPNQPGKAETDRVSALALET